MAALLWLFVMLMTQRLDEDSQRRQCKLCRVVFSLEITVGGNANGSYCMYPFIFRGVRHYSAIQLTHGKWCGTTMNYDIDQKWGYAIKKG